MASKKHASITDVMRLCGWETVHKLVLAARGQTVTIPAEPTIELAKRVGSLHAYSLATRMGPCTVVVDDLSEEACAAVVKDAAEHGVGIPDIIQHFGFRTEYQVRDALAHASKPHHKAIKDGP